MKTITDWGMKSGRSMAIGANGGWIGMNSAHRGTFRSRLNNKNEHSLSSNKLHFLAKRDYREEAIYIHSRLCDGESAKRRLREVGKILIRNSLCHG